MRFAAKRHVRDIAEQTPVGDVYLRSLIRTQLRLALAVGGVFAILLGALPLALAALPVLRDTKLFGVPLSWILLGVAVYPVVLVGAWVFVRAAERTERDFAELLEPDAGLVEPGRSER